MATETVNDPATVLTHPAFDRPPVDNQRRPGRKKGTLSMAKARQRRAYADVVAAEEARSMALTLPAVRPAGAKEASQTSDAASPAHVVARTAPRLPHEEAVIAAALAILEARLRVPGGLIESPQAVKLLLRLRLAELEHEVFGVLFLDARHAVIAFEILFTGTLTQTSVHPREIVKRALSLNAAAVVLAHNHPSGATEPSRADELVTMAVRAALQMVEVRVIDHVIVGRGAELSFAERGLI